VRRILTTVVAACALIVTTSPPAGASSPHRAERLVSGPFLGREDYAFGTNGCSFVHQVFMLTVSAEHKESVKIATDGCVASDSSGNFAYRGTFTLTADHRDAAAGAVSGTSIGGTDGLHLRLSITTGTGAFARIAGTIAVDGEWLVDTPGTNMGAASGTVSADLHRA
jgi:hypothetical protein